MNARTAFAISGDLGDCIFSLRIAHHLNDPESTYYLVDRPFTKQWTKERLDALVPLLEAQPYIGKVIHGEPVKPTHNMIDFRSGGHPWLVSLADLQARYLGITLPKYKPWLFVTPRPGFKDKVVIHRSPRYLNRMFPWHAIGEKFKDKLVAIGLPEEHARLEDVMQRKIPLILTENYLDCAEIIAGAGLFIGNQSSPGAMALGLGVPMVQETYARAPDCVYDGAPVFYGHASHVKVDGEIIGHPTYHRLDKNVVPPGGGWIFGKFKDYNFNRVVGEAIRSGLTRADAEDHVLDETTRIIREKFPTFQRDTSWDLAKLLAPINPINGVKSNLTIRVSEPIVLE